METPTKIGLTGSGYYRKCDSIVNHNSLDVPHPSVRDTICDDNVAIRQ